MSQPLVRGGRGAKALRSGAESKEKQRQLQGAQEHQQEGNASLPFLDAGEHMESLGLLSAAQIRLCHPRGFIVLSAESVVVNSLTCGGSQEVPQDFQDLTTTDCLFSHSGSAP